MIKFATRDKIRQTNMQEYLLAKLIEVNVLQRKGPLTRSVFKDPIFVGPKNGIGEHTMPPSNFRN